MSKHCQALAVGILLCILSGCTHTQLRYNAVHQGNSLNEVFEKQVLDNLALFTVKPSAIPSFAVPDSGSTNVTDTGSATGDSSNTFLSKYYLPTLSRENFDQWNLVAVHDSRRLALMQCAYQQAVGAPRSNCEDCCELDRRFRGIPKELYECNGPCAIQCGWLCSSNSWWDVPKCCCECYGFYCGTYVWVEPGNESHFSNLVLRVLEYATGDFQEEQQPTKVVKFYIDKTGQATRVSDAYGEVTAEVALDDPATTILRPAPLDDEQKGALKMMSGSNAQESGYSAPTPIIRRAPRADYGTSPTILLQLQQRLRSLSSPGSNR